MLLEHDRNYDSGMDALVTVCSGQRMLVEHERNYDLGMDALVTVCSWNTNGIMIWARPAPGHMRSRSLERSARPLKVGRAQPCHGCVLLFAQLQRRGQKC